MLSYDDDDENVVDADDDERSSVVRTFRVSVFSTPSFLNPTTKALNNLYMSQSANVWKKNAYAHAMSPTL